MEPEIDLSGGFLLKKVDSDKPQRAMNEKATDPSSDIIL